MLVFVPISSNPNGGSSPLVGFTPTTGPPTIAIGSAYAKPEIAMVSAPVSSIVFAFIDVPPASRADALHAHEWKTISVCRTRECVPRDKHARNAEHYQAARRR